jgi:hypothetical protein
METYNGVTVVVAQGELLGAPRAAGYCFGCCQIVKCANTTVGAVRACCRLHKCTEEPKPLAPAAEKPIVKCPHCDATGRKDNIARHIKKVHAPAATVEPLQQSTSSLEEKLRTKFAALFDDEDLTFEEALTIHLRAVVKQDATLKKLADQTERMKEEHEQEVSVLEQANGALKRQVFALEQEIAAANKQYQQLSDQWRREQANVAILTKRLDKYESVTVAPSEAE